MLGTFPGPIHETFVLYIYPYGKKVTLNMLLSVFDEHKLTQWSKQRKLSYSEELYFCLLLVLDVSSTKWHQKGQGKFYND